MTAISLCLAACACFGILLAQSWLPLRAGFLGAVMLVLGACWLRAYWQRALSPPEMSERCALLSVAGTLVCLGYLSAKLYQLGPELDIHTRAARMMAGDLWTLVAASVLIGWIARAPEATRDERDAMIAARALGFSGYALLALQVVLIVWISLAANGAGPGLSMAMLAHLFICSWMLAHVLYGIHCTWAYTRMRALADVRHE